MTSEVKVLYVTAFLDIGRSKWNTFRCSENHYMQYVDELVSVATCDKNSDIVLYIDDRLYDSFQSKPYGNKVQRYNIDNTFVPFSKAEEERIMASSDYQKPLIALGRQHNPEHCHSMYNIVNHNKVHFLSRALREMGDSGKYTHYIWIDVHYLRHRDIPNWQVLSSFLSTASSNSVIMGTSKHWNELMGFTPQDIVVTTYDHLQGSVIVAPSGLVNTLYSEYQNQLKFNYSVNIADDDQGIHLGILQRRSDLYGLLYTAKFGVFFSMLASSTITYSKNMDLSRIDTNTFSGLDLRVGSTDLCKIMTEEKSDKGNGWHNYTVVYDALFKHLRDRPVNLFEVGLGSCNPSIPSNMGIHGRPGASLYGWSRYFRHPKSICWGADIDKDIVINTEKIKTFYCDQLNSDVITKMWNSDVLKNIQFDIIIDDGLHTYKANVNLLANSMHKLRPGGIYIVEDIQCKEIIDFERYIPALESILPTDSVIKLACIPNRENKVDNNVLFIQKGGAHCAI